MATRRNVNVNSPLQSSNDNDTTTSSSTSSSSSTMPVIPSYVLYKLLFFSMAMIIVPIGSYFVLLNPVFKGNSTYAGAFAAVMANVVLIGYVVAAIREDDGETTSVDGKGGKRVVAGRVGVLDDKKGQ